MAIYIYREEIVPSCYQIGPFYSRLDKLVNKCGYILINGKNNKITFISKEKDDLGITPIAVYKKSLKAIENNEGFHDQKINLLRTMIYCLKSSTKRFYCTRGSQVNKSEPSKWFSEINKEKSRQKYWYYYQNEYYNKTIESWPYPDMERKVRGERILN